MNTEFFNKVLREPPRIHLATSKIRNKGLSDPYFLLEHWSLIFIDCHTEIYFKESKYELPTGNLCLLPPDTARQFNYKERTCHRTIHFTWGIEEEIKKSDQKLYIWSLAGKSVLFKNLHEHIVDNCLLNPAKAQAAFWHLLWEVSDCIKDEGKSIHPEIKKICAYIENNISSPINVRSILDQSSFSHTHLLRLFKQNFDCSIAAYIRSRRMNIAKYLLINSKMQVKEIALESGFQDLQHFNKVFRREFGMSPRAFRAEAQIPDNFT
jgi:AraC-like DNA-binding protein